MERLTRRMCGGWGIITGYELNTIKGMKAVVDRLAAYEDTGLGPEEVSDLLERFNSLYAIFDDLYLADPVHFHAFGDRVKRWYQAEKDGRLVVLPCKFWDNLYVLTNRCISLYVCNSFDILDGNKIFVNWAMEYGLLGEHRNYGVEESEFGKTVFLTRKEAVAALKKREEEDDDQG